MTDAYPMGATLTFLDSTATVSSDAAGVAKGMINGEPLMHEDGDVVAYVPVWCERDNNREPTTVFVAVSNVLNVSTWERDND
jgi:hypothetical protein